LTTAVKDEETARNENGALVLGKATQDFLHQSAAQLADESRCHPKTPAWRQAVQEKLTSELKSALEYFYRWQ
jgi:hypothetical protein